MTITVPSPVAVRRGYAAGSTVQPVPVESLSTPALTLTDEIGRIIRAVIGNVDSRADFYRLYLDGDNPPTTLVAELPWYALETYETGDLGDGVTRYGRAMAVLGAVTALSTVQSATTDSAIPVPGAPSNLIVTDNGDGTVDASWVLADAYHNELRFQAFTGSGWSTLPGGDFDSALGTTSASNIAVNLSTYPANGSGQRTFRIRVAQSGANIETTEYYVAVNDPSGFTPGTLLLTANSSVQVNVQFGADPSVTPSSVQIQRTLTSMEGDDSSWIDINGADNYSQLTGSGFNDANSPATNYSYRPRVVSGGVTKYGPIARVTTPDSSDVDIFFSDTMASSISSTWTKGGKWSHQASEGGFGRIYYDAIGTAGTQLKLTFPANQHRLFVAMDLRFAWPEGGNAMPKTMKFFDTDTDPDSDYSNTTFHGSYTGRDWYGFAFGQNRDAPNDTQRAVRFNGNHSVNPAGTEVYARGSGLPAPTTFTRLQVGIQQNTVDGGTDGYFICYLGGVLQLHYTNLLNRSDLSAGFKFMTLGDFIQQDVRVIMDVRNFVCSFTEMPD